MYTEKQFEQILKLRDEEQKDYADICKIMKLSQRKTRSLYQCAHRRKRLNEEPKQPNKNEKIIHLLDEFPREKHTLCGLHKNKKCLLTTIKAEECTCQHCKKSFIKRKDGT